MHLITIVITYESTVLFFFRRRYNLMDVLSSAAIDLEIRRSFPFLNVGPLFTDLLIPVPQFRYYLAALVQLLISHQFTLFIHSSIYYIYSCSSFRRLRKKRARKCERLHVSRYIVQ